MRSTPSRLCSAPQLLDDPCSAQIIYFLPTDRSYSFLHILSHCGGPTNVDDCAVVEHALDILRELRNFVLDVDLLLLFPGERVDEMCQNP